MRAVMYGILFVVLANAIVTGLQFKDSRSRDARLHATDTRIIAANKQIMTARTAARSDTCDAFENFSQALVKIIKDGQKGASKLVYYKEHPDEWAQVVARNEQAIKLLTPPEYC